MKTRMDRGTQAMVGKKLLLVDGKNDDLILLGGTLESVGYQVISATTMFQALRQALMDIPDLILMDINISDREGGDLCQSLKANSKTRDIPIVYIVGQENGEGIARVFSYGACDFITKPFNPKEIVLRLKAHIDLNEMTRRCKERAERMRMSSQIMKRLTGILPICCKCKRIRKKDSDPMVQDSWETFESYISKRSHAEFSHGLCPDCATEHYPLGKRGRSAEADCALG